MTRSTTPVSVLRQSLIALQGTGRCRINGVAFWTAPSERSGDGTLESPVTVDSFACHSKAVSPLRSAGAVHTGKPLAPRWAGFARQIYRIAGRLWMYPGLLLLALMASSAEGSPGPLVLSPPAFAHYIDRFNAMEDENVTNAVPNADSWNWLQKEIPFFECPDHAVEEMYYFRWWSFRKHLEWTPQGYEFSEFLTRQAPGSSALGHQIDEGRWLHDQKYLDDYVRYWLRDDTSRQQLHKYSNWLDDALYRRYLVTGDRDFLILLLGDLTQDYQQWEQDHLTPGGLFWQFDVRDGMEESISGSRKNKNLRPTINSYMYANARAISEIARMAGNPMLAGEFAAKAAKLRNLVQTDLWNAEAGFFEVRRDDGKLSNVREEIGFIPWMFDLPKSGRGFETAWSQLSDPAGFQAPFGLTTAERRSPFFRSHGYGHCEWDGAVWPFATSQTLAALANVLRDYSQDKVTSRDYFDAFLTYVASQHDAGKPYIGEYLDETTGQWINGKAGRSRYYNHSTFADLVITGVAGLVPRADATVVPQVSKPAVSPISKSAGRRNGGVAGLETRDTADLEVAL
jgi:hypothetical protein